MTLEKLFPVDELLAEIAAGNVSEQTHPSGKMKIFNYTPQATFAKHWNEVTMSCRGLIASRVDGEILARPFRKFFNVGTEGFPETKLENLPLCQAQVTQKLDGSLGILYEVAKERPAIATRGSFVSKQALWATVWYHKNCKDASWPEGHTALFEIVYKDNRIVCEYKWEGLALIGLVNNETGEEMSAKQTRDWAARNHLRSATVIEGQSVGDLLKMDTPNEEGFVLSWPLGECPPLKVKIKQQSYLRMHRILMQMSPQVIWAALRDGENGKLEEIVHDKTLPLQFRWFVQKTRRVILGQFEVLEKQLNELYGKCPFRTDAPVDKEIRKSIARWFVDTMPVGLLALAFMRLDAKDIKPALWMKVRPKGAENVFVQA